MAKHVPMAGLDGQAAESEPSWAALLDPAALEARLVEARARRALALAARQVEAAETVERSPRPERSAIPERPARAADSRPVERIAHAAPPADRPRPVGPPIIAPAPTPVPVIPPLVADARVARPVPRRSGARDRLMLLAAIFLAGGLIGAVGTVLLAPPTPSRRTAEAPAAPAPAARSVELTAAPLPAAARPNLLAEAPPAPPGLGAAPAPPAVAAGTEIAAGTAPEAPISAAPRTPAEAMTPAPPPPRVAPAPVLGGIDAIAALRAPSYAAAAAGFGTVPERLAALAPAARPSETAARLAALPGPPPSSPAVLAAARVFVHYPPSAMASAADAAAALRAAGVAEAREMPAAFSVGSTNVRFYHAADRDAALGIARVLATSLGDAEAPEVRDFTDFRPQPEPGLVEVWLAGEAPVAAAPRASAARPAAPRAITSQPTAARPTAARPAATAARRPTAAPVSAAVAAAARQAEAEEVERIVLQRAVERMLLEQRARN